MLIALAHPGLLILCTEARTKAELKTLDRAIKWNDFLAGYAAIDQGFGLNYTECDTIVLR